MDLVPDDVLACVLRCLAPRGLAASRCVCKAWCAVIDTHRLLRADLLPLSLYGIFFLEQLSVDSARFFGRPLTERKIAARFEDLGISWDDCLYISDHCNGLLLLWDLVANPATRQWVRLPECPPLCTGTEDFYNDRYLVFDPIVSPHYEVVSIPRYSGETKYTKESEWPPSPYAIHVFSSRTWRWEERSFVRQREATGTIADMDSNFKRPRAVYWREALYVHCEDDSIIRITLCNDKYQAIRSPTGSKVANDARLYLGKSKNGVYCAVICNEWLRLRIWLLNESCGQMEWVSKTDVSLQRFPRYFNNQKYGPWILQKVNHDEDAKEAVVEHEFEWDPHNGITLKTEDEVQTSFGGDTFFLGFHPYEEIAFLWVQDLRVVAYHLNSSKVQDLGKLSVQSIGSSFVYTPCWTGELFENN